MIFTRLQRSHLALALTASAVMVAGQVQAGTTGALTGFITDASGKPVANARVTVTSPALQGKQTAETNEKGMYRLFALPPGVYEVQVIVPGVAAPLKREGISVGIDTTLRVDLAVRSEPSTDDDVIVIAEDAPVVDQGSTTVGANLSEQFLTDVPAGRTTTGVLNLTPGAVNDAAGTGFRGATSPENNMIIDGVNTTSVIDGQASTALPIEFIQDMQVKTGGYEAEFGRATGAVVNVRTKSGGNEWHGDVWTYIIPFELPRKEASINDDPDIPGYDNAVRVQQVPNYTADFGFDIGGPLVKDKLWFWVGAQPSLASRTYRRTIGNTTEEFTGLTRTANFASKLSYQANEDHDFSLSFYGNPALRTGAINTTTAGYARDEDTFTGFIKQGAYDISGRWNGRFGGDSTNVELILGYHRQIDENGPVDGVNEQAVIHSYPYTPLDPNGDPYQCENVVDENGNVVGSSDCQINANWQTGSVGTGQTGLYQRLSAHLQTTHYLDNALGNHKIKWGADVEANKVDNTRYYVGGGYTISYAPGGGPNTPGEGFDYNYYFSYSTPVGGSCDSGGTYQEYTDIYTGETAAECKLEQFVANTYTTNYALYAQDAWSLTNNFTLNLGVRWDIQQLRDINGDVGLAIYDNIAPRLGFIWDPTKKGNAKVFGSVGRFYESIPVGVNDRSFSLEGIHIELEDLGAGVLFGGENSPVQRGLKGMYSDEAILGVEYEAANNLSVGAKVIHRQLGNVIEDISFDDGSTYAIANPGTEGEYYSIDPATGEETNLARYYQQGDTCYAEYTDENGNYDGEPFEVDCFPQANRTYDAVELTAYKRLSDNWQMLASYVLSATKGNYPGLFNADTGQLDPNISSQFDIAALLPNQEGWLAQDRRHAFKLHGSYQLPFGLLTGLGLTGFSGAPYSYLGNDVEHGYGQGEVYLASRGTAGRLPWQVQVDGNLGYRHQFNEDKSLTFTVAAFNLLNAKTATSVDENWTYDGTTPVAGATNEDQFICDADEDGTYSHDECTKNVSFGQPDSYMRPIHLRVGVKFTF